MTTWDLYFASLVAWTLHPGYLREGCSPPDLEALAQLADQMMEISNGRMGSGRDCRR